MDALDGTGALGVVALVGVAGIGSRVRGFFRAAGLEARELARAGSGHADP